ncbi:CLUMA_CG003746, isoform A [Clunio marinus]|uniref:Beta-1,4-galactosyltransferase 7 n=1 Tax=Clunio marinus TaxID=568069 RepID=A0A1J1HPQ6_9DIPT|nr:CLUMA_CG003746, isoform A [Clunio marinus]
MCIINILPFSFGSCKCADCTSTISSRNDAIISKYYDSVVENTSGKKKLAIIVPFRDRFDELLKFVPHMTKFLNNQQIPHHIFIINQIDRFRFNRASLINVGFLYTKENFDYIAMHDVDLLPLNENLKYDYPIDGPFHIAAPGLHPKYNYPTFIGGILLLKNEHFEMVNGMSNKYWGWGLEDDEFYVRLKDVKLKVYRPQNILTGSSDTFNHIHDRAHRRRDTTKCFNQKEETRKRDTKTGLNTIKYEIKNRNELSIDGIKVTILNVDLKCDKNSTPWCDCSNQESSKPMPRKGLRKKK